jgi:hypothetical protein
MSTNNSNVAVSATVAHIVDNSPTSVIDKRATITLSQIAAAEAGYTVGWNEVIADAVSVGTKAGKGDAKKALLAKIRTATADGVKALLLQAK